MRISPGIDKACLTILVLRPHESSHIEEVDIVQKYEDVVGKWGMDSNIRPNRNL